jgi:hypothetical protein
MKYRKKPIVIEAIQWTGDNIKEIFEWSEGCIRSCKPHKPFYDWICTETLEGYMEAGVDDWCIKGVEGEFYFCKDSVFKKTYEVACEKP